MSKRKADEDLGKTVTKKPRNFIVGVGAKQWWETRHTLLSFTVLVQWLTGVIRCMVILTG